MYQRLANLVVVDTTPVKDFSHKRLLQSRICIQAISAYFLFTELGNTSCFKIVSFSHFTQSSTATKPN